MQLEGTWRLVAWRRVAPDGGVSYPMGDDAKGTLTYTGDGNMFAIITAAGRPEIAGGDPLGGDVQARADAYSTCLAYNGTYVVDGDTVVHTLGESLYPNWSGSVQPRAMSFDDGRLTLKTPPMADGTVNELVWTK